MSKILNYTNQTNDKKSNLYQSTEDKKKLEGDLLPSEACITCISILISAYIGLGAPIPIGLLLENQPILSADCFITWVGLTILLITVLLCMKIGYSMILDKKNPASVCDASLSKEDLTKDKKLHNNKYNQL